MPRLVSNPPNPWSTRHVEWLGELPQAALTVYEEEARSLLSFNRSPDLFFRWSVNPYRGCQHACAYCYARPGHQYLGFGAGSDFDTQIVVKRNAVDLLERELAKPSWKRELVAFSGVTDCYQPLEASYELTRGCLAACLRQRTPVSVLTKSALVRRDVDLLAELAHGPGASVALSIPFAQEEMARKIEPWAPTPRLRWESLRVLSQAGISVGVIVAPLILGLNDAQVPEILERARAAGATHAGLLPLRLPAEVRPVFEERLRLAYPERFDKVQRAMLEFGGGRIARPGFGARMRAEGQRFAAVRSLFELCCRRLGLEWRQSNELVPPARTPPRQAQLFPELDSAPNSARS